MFCVLFELRRIIVLSEFEISLITTYLLEL